MFKPTMKAIAAGVCAASLSGCFQVQNFGPISGATVTVAPLRDQSNILYQGQAWTPGVVRSLVGDEAWSSYDAFIRIVMLGVISVEVANVDPHGLYLVTASGGEDADYDANQQEDTAYTPMGGALHAVMTGEQLINTGVIISPVSEMGWQWVRSSYQYMDDAEVVLDLDYVATEFMNDTNDDGVVDMLDLLLYNRMLNASTYRWDLSQLDDLCMATAGGESEDNVEFMAERAQTHMGDGHHGPHGNDDNDEDNNHFGSADYLGSFSASSQFSVTGDLSPEDWTDYQRLHAEVDMTVIITLSMDADVDFDLYVFDGEMLELGSSFAGGPGVTESVTVSVGAGEDLVVQPAQFDGSGNYQLSLSITTGR